MIEFKGELTGACKKFLLKRQVKLQIISVSITLVLFTIPTIWIAILKYPLALLFLIPYAMFLLFAALPPSKKSQKNFVPLRVFVDLEENMIVHQCETQERFHDLSSVKKVEDYEDWYYFYFYFSDRDWYFVCQKNLLTQGNLDEFEALFDGKLVCKTGNQDRCDTENASL